MTKINVLQVEQMDAQTLLEQIGILIDKRLGSIVAPPQSTTEQDEYLTKEQVSKLLQVSTVTVWQWSRKEILKSYRIGNKVRFLKSEVMTSAKAIQYRKEGKEK